MRINRGSDDAAGLSVALGLGLNSRVFGQALRNANDAISLLNVADGALGELSNVLIRLKELSQQAASGSLSTSQRLSLDSEAYGLTREFNRILNSTEFNGQKLLDGSLRRTGIQLGFNSDSLNIHLNDELVHNIGEGTFTGADFELVANARGQVMADFNGDGNQDVAVCDNGTGTISVYSGDGQGEISFLGSDIIAGGVPTRMAAGDLDGDSDMDLVVANGNDVRILINDGTGSLSLNKSSVSSNTTRDIALGDVNGDGIKDLAVVNDTGVAVAFGKSDGTFRALDSSYAFATAGKQGEVIKFIDMNGDDKLDIVAGTSGGGVNVYIGSGTGTFENAKGFSGAAVSISAADFNHDGKMDLAVGTGSAGVRLLMGNGDGTLALGATLAVLGSGNTTVTAGDVNGDGNLDLATNAQAGMEVLLGNGDGTFASSYTRNPGGQGYGIDLVDMNSDGVLDIVAANQNIINVMTANTQEATTIQRLDLTTEESARESLEIIDEIFSRLTGERGGIGSAQSRLASALNTLAGVTDGYEAARSRIVDVDTADESSKLIRVQLLQDAGAAVLAQANIIPGIALRLLQSI